MFLLDEPSLAQPSHMYAGDVTTVTVLLSLLVSSPSSLLSCQFHALLSQGHMLLCTVCWDSNALIKTTLTNNCAFSSMLERWFWLGTTVVSCLVFLHCHQVPFSPSMDITINRFLKRVEFHRETKWSSNNSLHNINCERIIPILWNVLLAAEFTPEFVFCVERSYRFSDSNVKWPTESMILSAFPDLPCCSVFTEVNRIALWVPCIQTSNE